MNRKAKMLGIVSFLMLGIGFGIMIILVAYEAKAAEQQRDSVLISLKGIDAEITQLSERQKTLMQQIEAAQKDVIYMQGMIDMLQGKRNQLTTPSDTTKAKPKKK